jgi:hypothetical protein
MVMAGNDVHLRVMAVLAVMADHEMAVLAAMAVLTANAQ